MLTNTCLHVNLLCVSVTSCAFVNAPGMGWIAGAPG